jgi:hypothetical protein
MEHLSMAPGVSVTIGCHTRQYFAYVTTAPDVFDSPGTLTLQHGPFAEVIAFAGAPMPNERMRRMTARLVLIDAMELAWQRAKYHGHQYLFLPADVRLAGPNTLQQWLWQRLEGRSASPAAA